MKILTWSDFDKYKPCYSPQEEYGDFSGTILDILKDKRIPDLNKIWAFTREGIVDEITQRRFACKCVRQIWHLITDEKSKKVVEVAEKFCDGLATKEELAAARDTARATVIAIARATVSPTVLDSATARPAATASARAAARATVWDSALDAAMDSSMDSAWAYALADSSSTLTNYIANANAKQVEIAKELLK